MYCVDDLLCIQMNIIHKYIFIRVLSRALSKNGHRWNCIEHQFLIGYNYRIDNENQSCSLIELIDFIASSFKRNNSRQNFVVNIISRFTIITLKDRIVAIYSYVTPKQRISRNRIKMKTFLWISYILHGMQLRIYKRQFYRFDIRKFIDRKLEGNDENGKSRLGIVRQIKRSHRWYNRW